MLLIPLHRLHLPDRLTHVLSATLPPALLVPLQSTTLGSRASTNGNRSNYHTHSGLKQHTSIISQFWMSEVQNQSHWANVKVRARLIPSGISVGKIYSLAFFSFRKASVFCFTAPSSCHSDLLFALWHTVPPIRTLLPISYKDPYKRLCWTHPDSPGKSPHLKILLLITVILPARWV